MCKGKGHQQARKVDRPKAIAETYLQLRKIAELREIARNCRPQIPPLLNLLPSLSTLAEQAALTPTLPLPPCRVGHTLFKPLVLHNAQRNILPWTHRYHFQHNTTLILPVVTDSSTLFRLIVSIAFLECNPWSQVPRKRGCDTESRQRKRLQDRGALTCGLRICLTSDATCCGAGISLCFMFV